jgi:hypothetical protein
LGGRVAIPYLADFKELLFAHPSNNFSAHFRKSSDLSEACANKSSLKSDR